MLGQQSGKRLSLHRTRAVVVKQQCAGSRKEPDDSQQKEDIADARGEKSFLGRRRRRRLLIPEADQQVRGESDDLPAHEQQQQAVRDHHAQHRSGKEREKAEEARKILVVRHVADGVDEDQQANEADHHQHHRRERIEHPTQVHLPAAELRSHLNPAEVDRLADGRAMRPRGHHVHKGRQREQQRKTHRPDGQCCGRLAFRLFQQRAHARGDHRHGGNQPENLRNGRDAQEWSE